MVGLLLGSAGLYGDPRVAIGATASTAGVLVPGLLGHDVFNLLIGLPLLLGVLWLTRRGSLLGLLLWPGALLYLLYTYAIYLLAAPFSGLFLAYVALVALSAWTTIGLVAAVDREAVRRQLAGAVPARGLSGLLVALALLTLAQDAGGALATAFAGGPPASPAPRPVWTVDLVVEVPMMLIGGVLLWRRAPLGYVVGAGLLWQYGLTPVALAGGLVLQAFLGASAIDGSTIVALLVFGGICFAPLSFFARGT